MKKLMIVDDEFLVRLGIASLMTWENYGYTIAAEASNGKEALEKIEGVHPDIVLTDLMMSPGDGFELIETCLKKYPEMKFIVLSNYNDFDNVRKAMKLGASDYVFKLTLKAEELLQILNEVSTEIKSNQNEEPENKKEKTAEVGKAGLLKRLMSARDRYYEETLRDLGKMPLCISFGRPYYLFYITIDNFKILRHRGNFLENDLLKFTMENMIHEIFGKEKKMEVFAYQVSSFLLIFNAGEERKEAAERFMLLRQYALKYFGVSLSASISRIQNGIENLREVIQSSEKLLQLCFWDREKKLLWEGQESFFREGQILENPDKKNLEKQLDLEGSVAGIRWMEEYLASLEGKKACELPEIRKNMKKAVQMFSYCMEKKGINIEQTVDKNGINLETAVMEYDYYADICDCFYELKALYLEQDLQKRQSRSCRREVTEVKKYVQEHLSEKLSVPTLAASVNMSESRFSHVFKKETGISFWEYVNQQRMDKAMELLTETDLRIGDVAEETGWENPNYFSTQFKKKTGKTPVEYRKGQQKKG